MRDFKRKISSEAAFSYPCRAAGPAAATTSEASCPALGMAVTLLLAALIFSASGSGAMAANPDPPLSTPAIKPSWPTRREGLLFAITGGSNQPVLVLNKEGGSFFQSYYDLSSSGLAILGKYGALRLMGGVFKADRVGSHLASEFKMSSQIAMEAWITPSHLSGKGDILFFAKANENPLFSISQKGNGFFLIIRTGSNGTTTPFKVHTATHLHGFHLLICASRNSIVSYVNGKKTSELQELNNDLSTWNDADLSFGNNAAGTNPWFGLLEGVALYSKTLSPSEVEISAAAFREKIVSRPKPRVLRLQATLEATSKIEKPEKIPYARACAMYLYKVKKVVKGAYSQKEIRVMHWVFVDKKLLQTTATTIGQTCDLTLEPLADNPSIESEVTFDTLPANDSEAWYDVGPLVLMELPRP